MLQKLSISDFDLQIGLPLQHINLFYQVFGQPIGTAPVVVVNHALTGNSEVAGKNGWWKSLIGTGKTIDTDLFTIIAINIPGNGFDEYAENLIIDYTNWSIVDIAKLFWKTLFLLQIKELFAVIGGSLGGAIAWEMAKQEPSRIQHLIPIATDWKATDWVIANVLLQEKILNNSTNAIADARLHAMMLYRTPQSFKQKFDRAQQSDSNLYQIESWLNAHGKKLENRFTLSAYKLMNHLLKTIAIAKTNNTFLEITSTITAKIHLIAVNSDLFFLAKENIETYLLLKKRRRNVTYSEIKSIHGHDAFLLEFDQMNRFLSPIFKNAIFENPERQKNITICRSNY